MTTPRLEIRLDRLRHNARTLVERLGSRGIAVTGVTKATLGEPQVARAMLDAGAVAIGESRIENVERLRAAGISAPVVLIRAPMPSQVDRVVAGATVSLNSEVAVLRLLAEAAQRQGRRHGVILMVELGDLREGLLPGDVAAVVRLVRGLPALELCGIGANLACQNGVVPDATNMAELSALADALDADVLDAGSGPRLSTVTGGNSANLDWALGDGPRGRIDDLRLGESILLGREPLHRRPIEGLRTDVFRLVGEVIEAKVKPSLPWGDRARTAFGPAALPTSRGDSHRVIVALGHQDVDPVGIDPPAGLTVLGASSDHLVLDAGPRGPAVGDEVRFAVDYSALVRAMTSPFVAKVFLDGDDPGDGPGRSGRVADAAAAPWFPPREVTA